MVTIIDWQLVLEFVKALAAPIATLTAAVIAAKLAVRTFLGQKAIERRLEWFARLHQQVDALIACAVNIRSLMEIDNLEALEKAKGSSSQFPNNSEQPAMKVTFTRAKTFRHNSTASRRDHSIPCRAVPWRLGSYDRDRLYGGMRERSSVSERTTSRGNGIAPVASDAPTLAFFGRSLTNRVKAEARSIGETQYCAQLPRGLTSACS